MQRQFLKGTLAISASDPSSSAKRPVGAQADSQAQADPRPERLSTRFLRSRDQIPESLRPRHRFRISRFFAQAAGFGLATGILELAGEFVRRAWLGESAWLSVNQLNPHYAWMVPASNALLFMAAASVLGIVGLFRPAIATRAAHAVYGFLLIFSLLLLTRSLDLLACLSLAGGITTVVVSLRGSRLIQSRRLVRSLIAGPLIVAACVVVAGFSRDPVGRHKLPTPLVAAPANAPNVLLIVLDTVRADALSCYGAARNTSPHLARLAREGVRFEHARAAAPWTLASIASMLTGRWPYELSVGPQTALNGLYPTLAEYLSSHGYATGGFTANYIFCTRRYGLDRGFSHYLERGFSFEDLLGSSALGRELFPLAEAAGFEWSRIVGKTPRPNAVDLRYYTRRRSASELNAAFLNWLPTQNGRPFFAFMNYFDAHAPYLTPPGERTHFGLLPETRADFQMLRNWDADRMKGLWGKEKVIPPTDRERTLARDCYDDCIAYMDQQVARLLAELDRRGLRENTLVIVTADHGEGFGENGLYGHFLSLHRAELDVPLLIFEPRKGAANRTVAEPVSLRNLPATVVDVLGLGAGSPFPGRSLARFWKAEKRAEPLSDEPVLSELSTLSLRALLSGTKVYIHHGDGNEQLFDHKNDPWETRDLAKTEQVRADLERFRETLSRMSKP